MGASVTLTHVQFNSGDFTLSTPTPNTITVLTAGTYLVSYGYSLSVIPTPLSELAIYLNNTPIGGSYNANGGVPLHTIRFVVDLSVSDTLQMVNVGDMTSLENPEARLFRLPELICSFCCLSYHETEFNLK